MSWWMQRESSLDNRINFLPVKRRKHVNGGAYREYSILYEKDFTSSWSFTNPSTLITQYFHFWRHSFFKFNILNTVALKFKYICRYSKHFNTNLSVMSKLRNLDISIAEDTSTLYKCQWYSFILVQKAWVMLCNAVMVVIIEQKCERVS